MDALSVYIPRDRLDALAAGTELPEHPRGALLFADISGFTPLTTIFHEELGGRRGAELVTDSLNRVYDALIERLHRYRGSVLYFSGDAITCWFDGDDGRKAAACALEMQATIAGIGEITTPAGTAIPLGIKIAATAGLAQRFVVGREDIQRIDVLAGRNVARLGEAEPMMKTGEVMIGAEILAAFGDAVEIAGWRSQKAGENFAVIKALRDPVPEDPWPEAPAIPLDVARPWLLPPVYQRLERGEGDFLAELRSTVSLFLRFQMASGEDDLRVGEKLNAFVSWVQTVLTEYGGFLIQITVGDKGIYLQATFGAPVTHGDDARRAVEAAHSLLALPANLKFIEDIQIGISQGRVWAGAYGAALRKTYGVLGREVNISARLMAAADPWQILVTRRIAEQAPGEFTPRGEMALKGVEKPVAVYCSLRRQAVGSRAGPGRKPTALVGRDSERRWLRSHLDELLAGRRGRLLVEGEPGIGKSSLLHDLLAEAEGKGVFTLYGEADPIERTRAYHAWIPLVHQALSVAPDDPAGLKAAIGRLLRGDPRLLERAGLLNSIFHIDLPETDLLQQMDAEVRAANVRELLITLLKNGPQTESPWLLVMDDVQWLDSASWALLEQAWGSIPDLLLVMAARSHVIGAEGEPPPPEYVRLTRLSPGERLQLSSLTPAESERLIRRELEVQRLSNALADLVYRRAEGHPFYTVEFARALRETNYLQIQDGEADLSPEITNVDDFDFPSTIHDVVTGRIDRLEPSQQLTVKVASVIGRTFSYAALDNIYPVEADRPRLNLNLGTLEKQEITTLDVPEPALAYAFKHMIFHEVAYSLLPRAQQRQLHLAVGEHLEQNHPEELGRFLPLLAHHWDLAVGDVETADPDVLVRALHYLEQAGEQAHAQFGEREAIRHFERAIELISAMEKRPDGALAHARFEPLAAGTGLAPAVLHRASHALRLGDAYLGLGHLKESRENYETALRLYGFPVARTQAQFARNLLVQVARQVVHRALPGRLSRRVAALEAQENARQVVLNAVRAYERLMKVFYYANEGVPFVNAGLTGLNLAEKAGPSSDLARIYANMTTVAGILPLHRLASIYSDLAMENARLIDQASTIGWVLTSTSVYRSGVCAWEEAGAALSESVEIYARLGDQRQYEETLAVKLTAEYFQGAFERSLESSTALYSSASRREDAQTQAWGLLGQVENTLRLGRLDEALQQLGPLTDLLDRGLGLAEEIWIYGVLALGRWRNGEHAAALEAADAAVQRIVKAPPTAVYTLEGYANAAEVFLEDWRLQLMDGSAGIAEARRRARRVVRLMGGFARVFPVGRPCTWRFRGVFHALDGRPRRARSAWEKALAAAEALEMPYEAGLAHLELGASLAPGDPARDTHLREARELLERVGAAHDLARAAAAAG